MPVPERAWGFESPDAHVIDVERMVVEVQQHFDAPPDAVYALLHDVERMAGLGPEHVTATWTSPTTFLGINRGSTIEWDTVSFVTVDEPPRWFAWAVGDPEVPGSTWAYTLEPDGDGTLVTQRMQHGPGHTFLREFCEAEPDRAEKAIARRSEQLRQNMATVLRRAAELLQSA